MKQIAGYIDILIMAPFYFGYIWAAYKFCKKYLGTTKKKELLFLFFSIGGWLLLNIGSLYVDDGYKGGREFLWFFIILSCTDFPAHSKKDSGTIFK